MNKKVIKITSGLLLASMIAYTTPIMAFTKEETVYSKVNSNGDVYQTIVSTHLNNDDEENILKDLTDLINIENTNGDEEYSLDGNEITWSANGSDIYYKGETQKELPIKCNITYTLDGKEIEASELAGKSGKVKITIEYENEDAHQVSINGKRETLYTPFVVVCGTMFNNTENENIEITNGKVVNDGTKTAVLAVALPGMQESLNISKSTLEIPSKIEITMDTTNFEQNNIVTFITPKIFEKAVSFSKLNELYSKIDTIQSSSKEIEDGANLLKEGTEEYSEKSQQFNSAVSQISEGMNSANESYKTIDNAINQLSSKSTTLEDGAKVISEGTKQISDNLELITSKLGEIETGSKTLEAGEKKLSAGLSQISESLKGISGEDNSTKIAGLKQLVATNNATIKSLTEANTKLTAQLDAVTDETQKDTITAQIKTNTNMIGLLTANVDAQNQTIETLENTDVTAIETLKAGINDLQDGLKTLQAGTTKLATGATTLKAGTSTLAEKSTELSTGATTLYNGTIQLSAGTKQLSTGSTKMQNGLETLSTSTESLAQASEQLTSAAVTLKDATIKLANGISTFNTEAINKICDYINSDIRDIATRAEKLQQLGEEYNNFAGAEDETAENVKFILITDSIKEKED